MNNQRNEDLVKNALEKDVNLSSEDYAKSRENASKSADFHSGETIPELPEWEAEERKHKRIQSNFYGTALNFFLAFQDHLSEIRESKSRIEEKLDLTNALLLALAQRFGIDVGPASNDGGGEVNAE